MSLQISNVHITRSRLTRDKNPNPLLDLDFGEQDGPCGRPMGRRQVYGIVVAAAQDSAVERAARPFSPLQRLDLATEASL